MIPNIQVSEGKIESVEFTVPLSVNGELINIKMRKLSQKDRREIKKRSMKTTYKGQEPIIDIDDDEYAIATLEKAIIEAPFGTTREELGNLSGQVIDYLFIEYTKSAEPTEKKNEDLEKD